MQIEDSGSILIFKKNENAPMLSWENINSE